VAAAMAYVSGIAAARALGAKVASFVGLTEVMFAVLWAWLLLAELPGPVQLLGGLFILAGVVCVKADERTGAGSVVGGHVGGLDAAVDQELGGGHEGAVVAGEEGDRSRHLLRLTEAP
jgi:hypothetical protein